MNNTWNEFKLRVNIDAPIDKVYPRWTTSGGLETWFLRKAIVSPPDIGVGAIAGKEDASGTEVVRQDSDLIQKGDRYQWYWHGYPDSVVEKGTILEANGKDRFCFSFSLGCPLSISLYRECDETIVELVESGLPADEETMLRHYVGDSKGWIFYLANLKSVLEGGLDLRNRKTELTNVITS